MAQTRRKKRTDSPQDTVQPDHNRFGGGGGIFSGTGGGGSHGTTSSSGSSSSSSSGGSAFGFNLQARAYRNIASQYVPGGATDSLIHYWINNGVSASEVQQRFMTIQRIREFKPWANAFSDVLGRQHGFKWDPNFNNIKNLLEGNSLPNGTKMSNLALRNIWGEAATEAQLRSQGIDIGKPGKGTGQLSLTVSQAHQVEAAVGRDASIAGAGGKVYSAIAQHLLSLPDVAISNIGLTKSDIIKMDAGGPGSTVARAKYAQAAANAAAYDTTQATNVPLGQQQGDVGYTQGSQ